MRKEPFGSLPSGEQAFLYTISRGAMTAQITDFGATLVRLYVPDQKGKTEDVVLGYPDVTGYSTNGGYLGATVGRNANRIGNASFLLEGRTVKLDANEYENCLHSGKDTFAYRFWQVEEHLDNTIVFSMESPNGDQGFPGNARIRVRYALEGNGTLSITYDAICDEDTVFNMTNHTYFNLAGHTNTDKAMEQYLTMPARVFNPTDAQAIPTGEAREVAGTPMDFRTPTQIGSRIDDDYDDLKLQGGYDHNFEVFTQPCAILEDRTSGRTMAVVTDCPGVQFYSGNYLRGEQGKDGVCYIKRSGVCLETQFWPDAVNKPHWEQPITKAGERYRSQTKYIFK